MHMSGQASYLLEVTVSNKLSLLRPMANKLSTTRYMKLTQMNLVPYFPAELMTQAQKRIYGFGGFSANDIKNIRNGNALELFRSIVDRLRGMWCPFSSEDRERGC
jgi:hypothetical protein